MNLRLDPSSKVDYVVANGDSCSSIGCVRVPFKLMNRVELIDVLVVPELRHFLILGIDFWKRMQIIPDLRSDNWSFFSSVPAMSVTTEPVVTVDQSIILESLVDEYFSNLDSSLGCTTWVEHEIYTDSPPIKQRYYPVSPHSQNIIDNELDKMLSNGVIERSNSP